MDGRKRSGGAAKARSKKRRRVSDDDEQTEIFSRGQTGTEWLSDGGSTLRIVLLGKSEEKKTELGNFITGSRSFHVLKPSSTGQCEADCAEWRGKLLTVVKTPDVFILSEQRVRQVMESCVTLCPPGPNVLLLFVRSSDFTEENRQIMKFILSLFGPDAFKHSMVIVTHKERQNQVAVNELRTECGGRQYNMYEENHNLLMEKIENIASSNKETFLTFSEEMKPSLNLVLCGTRGEEKTSAAEVILGQTELHSVSSSSECVKHHGEVCGRRVSLVELPALYGKPQEVVMEQSFRSISLCDPEGVHAFILVLPVGPLTDEDKEELKTFQDTFSSRVNDFTMILFTVESESTAPALVNFVEKDKDMQELCKNYRGRSVIFNIEDKQEVHKILDTVDRIRLCQDKPYCYTPETFVRAQIENITTLRAELQDLKTKSMVSCDDGKRSPECVRIVLIGKTGSGKSSSGNTILGKKQFEAKPRQKSVTKHCVKAHGDVDGRRVVVVDTPGLFDTDLSHEEVHKEMVKCFRLLAPGPHVFLLVLQIGRLTAEDKKTLKLIRDGFGKNAEKFTIVLFTHGDTLEQEEQSIDNYISNDCDASFKKLISDYGRRYHMFNNFNKHNRTQVSELMDKIDTMMKDNGGSCYTKEMLPGDEAAVKKKEEEAEMLLKKKEEEMRREIEELKRKHQEEMKEMKRKVEQERKQRDREVKQKELEQKKSEQEMRGKEERKRKQQEETGRQELERKVEALEEKISRSESESKETIERKLEECREEMRKQQEAWKKKQSESWEKSEQKRRQEEQTTLRKLQEQYEKKRGQRESERKEEDRIRREGEEKERKKLEESCKRQVENLKKTYEKAKKKAEEFKELEEKHRRESADKQQEYETEMRKQREAWEKKLKEMEEQRQREGQTKLRKLQDEYEREREQQENKRKEEDRVRREGEEKERKQVEEMFKRQIEDLKKTYEEKAEKHRRELADQQQEHEKYIKDKDEKYEKDMEDKDKEYILLKALSIYTEKQRRKKHRREMQDLVQCVSRKRENLTKISDLLSQHEEKMKDAKNELEKSNLQQEHEEGMSGLIKELQNEADRSSCRIS